MACSRKVTCSKTLIGLYAVLVLVVVLVFWNMVRLDFRNPDINSVLFSKEQVSFLQAEYRSRVDVDNSEFVYCLSGKVVDGVAVISDIDVPRQMGDSVSAEYSRCGGVSNLGALHFQPRGRCDLSKQDFYSFGRNKYVIFGVMCGETDIGLFSNKNLYSALKVNYQ